jgi:hypothetical protein
MQLHRFILQAVDPDYGHPAFETMFLVERLEELQVLVGAAADDDPALEMVYTLDLGDLDAINHRFGLAFDPGERVTRLAKWASSREPPYLVHTGFELVLMIDGRKAFARMGETYPPHQHYDEDLFDRHVALSTLHKEVQLEPFAEPVRYRDGRILEGLRTVYYTLKGQEWRIPAWKLVSEASSKSGWNDHFERLEGMLFGYEEWQNDWWLSDIRRRNIRWGTLSLYLAVNENELTAIDDAGHRALPLRSKPLRLLTATWEGAEEAALRGLLEEDGTVGVVRFSVKAGRFLRELASDPQAALHTLSGERVKDLNRLMVGEIEVVMPSAAARGC